MAFFSPPPTKSLVEWTKYLLSLLCIGFLACFFVKCSVDEISLLAHWDYGIAHVTELTRVKGEMHIGYWYEVAGVRHTRGSIWDGKARPGERYVVRYGTFSPDGNDFLYKRPIPDSITEASGNRWKAFLRHSHYHPPYIPYHAIMGQP
ncbi:hypothetical protein J7E24_15725 [Hymenobacter sp. ISL-91]|uniref:hypothetical protein n=1 Tax=Hymenobacter sp. ISL-91 TaxID=2819151 RepID=UPI001BE567DA|nr:hypothetical protein [Hymenobacter sp. ISL-91]MBT2559238.1 hypothetical protein [Hymenobacter sp. ISL-91]